MPYKDPATKRANDRAYRLSHREQRRANDCAYREANREQRRANDRAYRLAHLEQCREKDRAYRKANQEQCRQRQRTLQARWAQANPEKRVVIEARRRARKRNAPINDLTRAQWQAIKAHYGHRCVYCGKTPQRLTMDHIVPLAKGGYHTASNVVPACQSCNSRKHTGAPLTPIQPLVL